jgi:hypothetical protein
MLSRKLSRPWSDAESFSPAQGRTFMTHWRATEAPAGPFQAGPRHAKTGIAYSTSLAAVFDPGEGMPFFRHRPQSLEALAAEMARLAYRDFGPGGRALSGTLSLIGFNLETTPFDDGNTQAFLAGSEHLRVLSIRGSDDLRAWQTNARTRPVPWEGPGLVHEGFAEAWRKAHESWAPALAAGEESGRPLLITGHSLGGALATLAAAHNPHSLLYSFGVPRVGNRAFAHAMDLHAERLHRYVNFRDPVPLLPPGLLGYRHCGSAYHIDRQGAVGALPPTPRRVQLRDMDALMARVKRAIKDPARGLRNDLTDHAPLNYVSALR